MIATLIYFDIPTHLWLIVGVGALGCYSNVLTLFKHVCSHPSGSCVGSRGDSVLGSVL